MLQLFSLHRSRRAGDDNPFAHQTSAATAQQQSATQPRNLTP
ncbi:hypothetical protein XCR_0023 [Xanthomonas campestris pv. raphani 756C]|nr:hypothetical protein XCR_0023 [Xanthomonas campestris pv. raphani 756C]